MPRRLAVDWKTIKALYIAGETYSQLADAYGVAESSIRVRSSRERWGDHKKIETPVATLEKIWANRRERIREGEYKIADKMISYAEQMPEDQLLNKADKVKVGLDIGRRSVGLDEKEDKNIVNIALLGSYSDSGTIPTGIQIATTDSGTVSDT